MSHVVVIEAPGKIRRIARLFRDRGEIVLIAATKGHLYDLPDDKLGIDLQLLKAKDWVARNPEQLARVEAALKKADRVTLLTDADVEGEVIASEALSLVGPGIPVQRARLTSLSDASLDRALKEASAINESQVQEGLSRRITDRILGYGFQDPKGYPVAMGRVITPTLSSLASCPATAGIVEVEIPAADKGPAWRLAIPYEGEQADQAQALAQSLATLPPPEIQSVEKMQAPGSSAPHNMGSALLLLSSRFNQSIESTEAALQSLYMQGRLTYARTASHRLAPEDASWINRIGTQAGIRGLDAHLLAERPALGAHGAIAPIGEVPLGEPTRGLSFEEQCLVGITEQAIEAAMPAKVITELGQFKSSGPLGAWHGALSEWDRPVRLVRQWRIEPPYARMIPWDGHRAISHRGDPDWSLNNVCIFRNQADWQALSRLISLGLGQPSTLGGLSGSIARRFLTDRGVVNGLGHQAIRHARACAPRLLEAEFSRDMDRCFSQEGLSIPDRVRSALACLDLSTESVSLSEDLELGP